MIELKDDVFYYGFWFCGIGHAYDWLAIVWREEDRVVGRFRHRYGGSSPIAETLSGRGDSEDRRSWYSFGGPLKPNAEVCADVDRMMELIIAAARTGGFVDPDIVWTRECAHVCAMGDEFQRRFSAASFVHARAVEEHEREDIEREIAAGRSC